MIFDFSNYRRSFPENFEYLNLDDLSSDPFKQCKKWFEEVVDKNILDGNAMTLSTSSLKGEVSARIVLLKYLDSKGFVFFTNYKSEKGKQIEENPKAALTFYWPSLNRQLRIKGSIEKISKKESYDYYSSRPRENQLLAWASEQGSPISSTEDVLKKMKEIDQKHKDQDLPLPPYWGGYRLLPKQFEFWQGGPARINQRFLYQKKHSENWSIDQLSP